MRGPSKQRAETNNSDSLQRWGAYLSGSMPNLICSRGVLFVCRDHIVCYISLDECHQGNNISQIDIPGSVKGVRNERYNLRRQPDNNMQGNCPNCEWIRGHGLRLNTTEGQS